ncbi:hypothetical protein PDESU_04528 [Pontiella desulfatans]|uniref:CBM-cenC domain-containing protein n=1 Tax=Pontiella desulfatans TaxID=2750659 RepID=A0A6C2U7U3_PONDE|nr:hypothetical protein [Pontiella desulfatans]VGO15939.1 hypothetical protein PDESU_04528 [Pontiella desulfatans]
MKTTIIAATLLLASIASANDLSQLYEKAYFLETAKGEREASLKIYREIAATPATDRNQETIIKTLRRMLVLYEASTGEDMQAALAKLNLDFEQGAMAPSNPYPAMWGGGGNGYEIAIDSKEKKNGNHTCRIRQTGQGGFATITGTLEPKLLAGRKVRMSGYLKLDDVSNMAGLWLRADQDNKPAAFYNMADQQLKGSKDWKHYSFELIIPAGVDNINFGALMSGSGTLWIDDINIEFVD